MTRFSPPTRPLILLVEDEPLVRETNIDVLQEAGFRVIEARNADEAFGLLRHRPDVEVVLTDVDMPGSIDGFEFARLAAQGWPDVRVVVISGKTTPGPEDLPEEAVFLAKPFRPENLRVLLRRLADRTGPNESRSAEEETNPKQASNGEDRARTGL
jgi:two-component system, response regulator PdtaR